VDTKNTVGHDAVAQQVRAVVESLDRADSTLIDAGDAQADFRTVSITTGEAIRKWVLNENATHLNSAAWILPRAQRWAGSFA
jgi:hypothetical protein